MLGIAWISVLTHIGDVWIEVTDRSTIMDKERAQSFKLVVTSFPNSAARLQA